MAGTILKKIEAGEEQINAHFILAFVTLNCFVNVIYMQKGATDVLPPIT